ncbi:hypothetical protein DFH09DRAFT_108853 [Mycena vulgaris]|nr:hypothetical protein DFH09DRAFT_108853 [Mycena vulgaris]
MSVYEVETVTEARVAKKSKKVIWEYHVKWKGYNSEDNTWEPVASFSGSEEILTKFWARVDVGDRDIKNMTQFSVGETFIPVGPPRRMPSRRSTKADVVASTPPPSAGPSKESTRASKRRRSSPPVVDLEEKPAKRTRGRVSESATRSIEEPRTPREPARRPPARPTTSSARSIRRTKKRTPSPEFVPASEEEEDDDDVVAMLVDPPQPQSFGEPSTDSPTQKDAVDTSLDDSPNQGPSEPMQDEAPPPSKSLPSHRARAANPLVKIVDDIVMPMDGAISVKARLQGRNGTTAEAPIAGPSGTSTRKSPRKPGPGRSSAGMLNKNTSSLLTFDKGGLKTVKGKFTAPPNADNKAEGGSGSSEMPVSSSPAVPPTSDELLKLGGFDSKDAEALDDFEDDIAVSPEATASTNENDIQQQSLTLAKNKLFPPGMSMASTFSNKVTSVWRRATIFGPLFVPLLFVRQSFLNVLFHHRGLGSDAVPEMPSESKPFLLKLDATVGVPLDLTDISQSLDTIICKESSGPPGKFFLDTNARTLLDTVRTGGPSARVTINEGATEEQKTHFARFRSRLDQGELFTAMVGSVFLAVCSSETPLMQRLNLPPTLVSFPNSIFVTQLVIENFTAYVEVAETADTSRW